MDCSTPMEDLLTVKLLLNSIISTPGAKFTTSNMKDSYLNTPMEHYTFLRMKIGPFSRDVIDHYKLKGKVCLKGNVYARVEK